MTKMVSTSAFSLEVSHWLNWQCRMISNVKYGEIFLTVPQTDNLQSIATWPKDEYRSSMLATLAQHVIKSASGGVKKSVNDGSLIVDYITHPLIQKGKTLGVVVLGLSVRSEQQCQAVLQLLQWGTVFLEKILERSHTKQVDDATLALNALALLSMNEPLAVTGYHFCNFIADNFDCSRVELGLCKGLQVQILSLSHQLHFDRRIERVRQVEFAMEECIEQNQNIIFPTPSLETTSLIYTHT